MIQFDCSEIPSNARVTNALLSLTGMEYGGYGDANVCIYTLDKPWKENEVSWSNATNGSSWQNPGGDYSNLVLKQRENFDGIKKFTFDVTSAVKTFVNNPSSNNGFVLIPERIADIIYHFKSKENSDNAGRPKLIISYDMQSDISNAIKFNDKSVSIDYKNSVLKISGLKNGNYKMKIYNLKGKSLSEKCIKVSDKMFLEKSNYSKGTFVVNVKGDNLNINSLLIVK